VRLVRGMTTISPAWSRHGRPLAWGRFGYDCSVLTRHQVNDSTDLRVPGHGASSDGGLRTGPAYTLLPAVFGVVAGGWPPCRARRNTGPLEHLAKRFGTILSTRIRR